MLSSRKRKNDDQPNQRKLRKLNAEQNQAADDPNQNLTKKLLDHFQSGDLVFGLTKYYRTTILDELKKMNYHYTYANELNMPTVRYILENAGTNKIDKLTVYQKEHYEFLSKHKGYLTAPGSKSLTNSTNNKELDIAIRRACKLMVCYASEKHRIHYELDHIDIERVCKPKLTDLSISSSEIKAAYRQSKVKDNPHLFFYMKGEPVPAPWKKPENIKHFQAYDDYRKAKMKN